MGDAPHYLRFAFNTGEPPQYDHQPHSQPHFARAQQDGGIETLAHILPQSVWTSKVGAEWSRG